MSLFRVLLAAALLLPPDAGAALGKWTPLGRGKTPSAAPAAAAPRVDGVRSPGIVDTGALQPPPLAPAASAAAAPLAQGDDPSAPRPLAGPGRGATLGGLRAFGGDLGERGGVRSFLDARFDARWGRSCPHCEAAGTFAAAAEPDPSVGGLLPGQRPTRYDVNLRLEPAAGTFTGKAKVLVALSAPTHRVILHAAGLEVSRVTVAGKVLAASQVALDAEKQTMTLTVPAGLSPGRVSVEVEYAGRMDAALSGLYRTPARGPGRERTWVFSQLFPGHARRVLPSFDHPSYKAPFRLTLDVPGTLTPLSNMPAVSETAADGRRVAVFAETPPMPTYLLAAFAAKLSARTRRVGKTLLRAWAPAGDERKTKAALDAAARALRRLERYFDLPYALPKLDLVATPDLQYGAMENWGAILFRASVLLLDDDAPPAAKREALRIVVHEIVHQWFGNLVTMKGWNDLWLNEAFATWLATKVLHAWRPGWRMWESFAEDAEEALALDALPGTGPVRPEGAADGESQVNDITYDKGGAVLNMLEGRLGERAFRRGLRTFLARHRGGSADVHDLARALEEASGEPVREFLEPWLTRPGMPVVSASSGGPGGRTLALRQRRFGGAEGAPWPVPLLVRYRLEGEEAPRQARVLLEGESATVTLPGRGRLLWAYPNGGETAYARVELDEDLLARVLERRGDLAPVERAGLIRHLWASTLAGDLSVERFLASAAAFKGDASGRVLDALEERLWDLHERMNPEGEDEKAFRALMTGLVGADRASPRWTPASTSPGRHASLLARLAAAPPQGKSALVRGLAAFTAPRFVDLSVAAALDGSWRAQDVALLLELLFQEEPARDRAWELLLSRWAELTAAMGPRGLIRVLGSAAARASPARREALAALLADPARDLGASRPAAEQALAAMDATLAFRGREGGSFRRALRAGR